jgi:integrase
MAKADDLPRYYEPWKGLIRIRVQVPPKAFAIIGKRNLYQSLGTGCRREALKRGPAVIAKFLAMIDDAKTTDSQSDLLVRIFDDMVAMRLIDPVTETETIKSMIRDVIRMQEPSLLASSSIVLPPVVPLAPVAFARLVDSWGDSAIPKKSHKARKTALTAWGKLMATVNVTDPALITKTHILALRDRLIAEGLKSGTIRNAVKALSIIFQHAVDNGKLAANPCKGVKFNFDDDSKKYRCFSAEEATRILSLARNESDPVTRWSSLIMYFSGMRIGELVGSSRSAVQRVEGIDCIVLNDTTRMPRERIKTGKKGYRTVPLHSIIISEGFLAYVNSLPKESALFPNMETDRDGRRSNTAGKRLSNFIRQRCQITDPLIKPSHSFRHTVETTFSRLRVAYATACSITGRTIKGSVAGYLHPSLAELSEAIENLPNPLA